MAGGAVPTKETRRGTDGTRLSAVHVIVVFRRSVASTYTALVVRNRSVDEFNLK